MVLDALRSPPALPGVSDHPGHLPDVEDILGIVEVAQRHRVSGYVYRMLRAAQVTDAEIMTPLRRAVVRAAAMHMDVIQALRRVGEVFSEVGTPWAVLKGPVLAARYHQEPQLRSYADLDVLVPGSELRAAIAGLQAFGANVHPDAWRLALHDGWGEIPVVLPSGLPLDLHWHLLNRQTHRAEFTVDIPGVMRRVREVEVDGLQIPTLDSVDTVAHLCLHATTSGGNRLIWFKDIERVLRLDEMPWGALISRVEDWCIELPAAVMLDRSRALVGAPVPEALVQRLATSRGWLNLGRAVRHVAPPAAWRGGGSLDRLVTRATRQDGKASTREMLTRGLYAMIPDQIMRADREDGSFGKGISRASSDKDHYLQAVERASEA